MNAPVNKWIRIGDHRVSVDQLACYYPAGEEAEPHFKTEIELTSGSSFFVVLTPEDLDEAFTPRRL